MIHAKRSLTSGLINHFFSSPGFRGNTFLFSSHSLSLSFFSHPHLPPIICTACHLLTFWHASSPISLLLPHLLPNLFRWGKKERGTGTRVTKVWKEERKGGESVGRRPGGNWGVVNQVWWNQFTCRLAVRVFLITHRGDTSTLMPHATLPGAQRHSDKNNTRHSLWWQCTLARHPSNIYRLRKLLPSDKVATAAVSSTDMFVNLYYSLWLNWQSCRGMLSVMLTKKYYYE